MRNSVTSFLINWFMNKLLIALTVGLIAAPAALADPQIEDWKTPHSMGCMLVRECVEGTTLIKSTADLEKALPYSNFDRYREEANAIIAELDKLNVNVYLADDRYFPPGHAGVYYVPSNDMFLNKGWVDDPMSMMMTLRHEAWHAAQDAMAGTIDNGFMAVIEDDKKIPKEYKLQAEILYAPSARPWEQEAKWAGGTPWMTVEVLKKINSSNGRPWEVISPTPLTRMWLERNGYL